MTEIFLDTANIEEIKEILEWGVIKGITTNQKIFLNEKGCDFKQRVKEIAKLVDPFPVSVEGPNDYDSLIDFAKEVCKWGGNIVIKVPMLGNGDGIRALNELYKLDIKTNVTACMTLNQVVLASSVGANYISLFYRRMYDMKGRQYARNTIKNTMDVLNKNRFNTSEIIIGSIRTIEDVEAIMLNNPDIITIPYKILKQMPFCQKTEDTLKEFEKAWEEFNKV